MKKFTVILLAIPLLLSAYPTIDGIITPEEGWELIGYSQYPTGGGDGANLEAFFYALSEDTLYLAITTSNTASWDIAYGFGVDFIEGSGYYEGNSDAWGRQMNFTESYALEDEIYFWWSGYDGAITTWNTCRWNGSGWDYLGVDNFAWTGGENGLQTLELAVSWATLTFSVEEGTWVNLSAWVAGAGGSSAVDVIPYNESVQDGGGAEWTDSDTITSYFNAVYVAEGRDEEINSPVRLKGNVLEISVENPSALRIDIYDASGRHISTPFDGVISTSINLPLDIKSGIYFYVVKLDGKTYRGKLLSVK